MSRNPYEPSESSDHFKPESDLLSDAVVVQRTSTWQQMKTSEDWWSIWCAGILLIVSFAAVWISLPDGFSQSVADGEPAKVANPLKSWLSKPGKWSQNPIDAFYVASSEGRPAKNMILGTLGSMVAIGALFAFAIRCRGQSATKFLIAFPAVFLLAIVSYVLASQTVINAYNLEYALWALLVGLIISNTVGTPEFLKPAILTEFFIKTGLVLLGAEVLMSRLMALGIPGIGVAWIVTPIVLISTYVFGQKVLKMPSKSLNMVICADMSVCGVSAAIATAAACKAKKEELSLAIGLSLSFTVVMMVVMPLAVTAMGLSPTIGGAWIGGTIDATGAVAVAGAALGEEALEVAATVKMIQNVLIGVTAFCVATYWVTCVESDESQPKPGIGEIWYRFPKFVLGFIGASLLFSAIHARVAGGDLLIDAMIDGSTKTFRSWFFCLAFVCIGLDTHFKQLLPYFRGGKPMLLYVCGQSLNIVLTLIVAYLMFGVLFPATSTGLLP